MAYICIFYMHIHICIYIFYMDIHTCICYMHIAYIISEIMKSCIMQGSFRGGTHGNAVPIVEKLPERMGMAFPLLKCLRTHKTHLKLRKKNKIGLRLLPYAVMPYNAYNVPRVVVQLTLRKIINIVANRWRILWLKCTKFDFGWGSAPDPRWGSLQRPQTP